MCKFTFPLVGLLCCVQWSLAAPSTTSGPPSDVRSTTGQPNHTKLRQSFTALVSSAVEFASALKPTVVDDLTVGPILLFWRMVLRMELYTMATGNHFALFAPQDMRKHKMADFFVTRCWGKLSRMEQADAILSDAVESSAQKYVRGEINGSQLMDPTFVVLESYVESDPRLRAEFEKFAFYDELQDHKTYFTAERTFPSDWNAVALQWLSDHDIQPILINRIFVQNGRSSAAVWLRATDYERFVMVRSILALAQRPADQKLAQKLYDDAVLDTVLKFRPEDYPHQVANIFFENLRNTFEKRVELGGQFEQLKNEITKQITIMIPTISTDSWLPF